LQTLLTKIKLVNLHFFVLNIHFSRQRRRRCGVFEKNTKKIERCPMKELGFKKKIFLKD
jgi:hypothetical protein